MPAGIDPQTVIVALWALAAMVMAWTWLPAFIASLGGTRYLCDEYHDMVGLEPSANEPDYSYWAEQLLKLGYEPLGNSWMRINFAGSEWSLYSQVRVFKSPSKQCYAYMQKAPAPFHFWPGAVFATCLTDGRLLLTDNNLAADPHPDDDFIRQGVVSLRLEQVEEFHLATLEVLRRGGAKAEPELNLDTLLNATRRYLGPDARRYYGREGTQYLFAHGLIHLSLSTPIAYVGGLTHWSVPLANLALALLLLPGENLQKRQYAKAARQALAEQKEKLRFEV